MAHVGKYYPVHFRRDLNLDLFSNTFGIARAYGCQSQHFTGSVGSALNSRRLIANAVDEPTFQLANWLSEYELVAGRQVRFNIESSVVFGFPQLLMRVAVEDQSLGILGYGSVLRTTFTTGYNQVHAYWVPTFPYPALFSGSVGLSRWDLRAVEWEEYNVLHP